MDAHVVPVSQRSGTSSLSPHPSSFARRSLLVTSAAFLVGMAGPAVAQQFPERPLRIVTSQAGGGNDVQARTIALGLTQALGQQVIVDNRSSGVSPEKSCRKPFQWIPMLLYTMRCGRGRSAETPYNWCPISAGHPVPMGRKSSGQQRLRGNR